MRRRGFICCCGAAIAALPLRALPAPADNAVKPYARVQLTLPTAAPIKAAELRNRVAYVFHYPYAGTPCLLLRLEQKIVAYSAICPHQLSYLGKKHSFINYRADTSAVAQRDNVIVCCAHHSVYDPAAEGRVLSGPAAQPLTSIALQHEYESDTLYAVGTRGAELFEAFFRAYKIELIESFGRGVARQLVSNTAVVQPVSEFCQNPVLC